MTCSQTPSRYRVTWRAPLLAPLLTALLAAATLGCARSTVATAATPAPAADRAPAGVRERELTLGSGDWKVGATLSMPKGTGPFPGVVLIPGSGPADRDLSVGPNKVFREIAWGLAQRGVAVLRFDKRTRAHEAQFSARGRPASLDEEFTEDATAAVRALLASPEIDRRAVYVLGHSQGTLIAPLVATRIPEVRGVVLVSAAGRPTADLIEEQVRYVSSLAPNDTGARQGAREMMAGVAAMRDPATPDSATVLGRSMRYWRDVDAIHPIDLVGALVARGGRALVVHGGRDYLVTDADFARWKGAFGADSLVTLRRYDALNHLMQAGVGRMRPEEYGERRPVDDAFLADLARWLRAGR
ncbi:MAG TPA: alpha/beta fold hydrolase [Gemmatimonadaceae bacterium]|nr:alpha/beta fold hydrolase [Gemmatimonadaceae bacterium]